MAFYVDNVWKGQRQREYDCQSFDIKYNYIFTTHTCVKKVSIIGNIFSKHTKYTIGGKEGRG